MIRQRLDSVDTEQTLMRVLQCAASRCPAGLRPGGFLVMLAFTGTTLAAQAPTDVEACFVPDVGAIYLINRTGLAEGCLAVDHVAITWPAGAAVPDHGALGGLEDDDHPQYLVTNGVRSASDGFAVTGPTQLNGSFIPVSGAGKRLMWYSAKSAFRAGEVNDTQWDNANVGSHSVATGSSTMASGSASTALGSSTAATGSASTAMGTGTTASGDASTAMGENTTASGRSSTAMGRFASASGAHATATGYNTSASGGHATAMGFTTTASGSTSTALGNQTTAQAHGSLVIGRWNVVAGDPDFWISSEPLFVAGNGASAAARSNALTLLKDGNLTIAGSLTQASDIRLKDQIEPLEGVLPRVLQLTPLRYRFRDGTGHPTEPKLGLSAQAVEPLFPELVKRGADGYLSVAYADLSAVLIGAIREQNREIEALRARLAALEERSR